MWLFQGVPEAIGVAAVMFAVAGLGLRWRTIVPMGILFGAAFYLVRLLPISFGVHTVINFLFVVLVFKAITSSNLNIAIRGGIVGLLTVIIVETVFFTLLFAISGISLEQIYSNIWLRVLSGWPSVLILFAIALLINQNKAKKQVGGSVN